MALAKQEATGAAQRAAGMGQLIGTGLSAMGFSDRNLKEDIEPTQPAEIINKLESMLDELKGYKYNYKDEDS